MSKPNRAEQKIRPHNGSVANSCAPASGGRNPIAFACQLAAQSATPPATSLATSPATQPAVAPALPSAIASTPARASLFARLAQRFFVRYNFTRYAQRLGKRLLKRRGRRRKLELQEIQQLGEKRFLAIVRVGRQKFLIGGAAASVALLAEIHGRSSSVILSRSPGQEGA